MSYTASYIVNSSSAQGTTDFQFTFPYIKEEHIEVYLNYNKITQGSGSAQYQVITNVSPKLIRLNTGITSANLRVEVRRNSSLGSPLVDYADGSTLTANDLDTSALQSLYIDQELKDAQGKAVSVDETTGLPTLNNSRLTNVADPTAAQDAATKNYVDTTAEPKSAKLTELATMAQNTANALADLTEAEVQTLDGLTASTDELNKLDGVTATTAELNYVDGVTSNVQTQLDAKQPLDAELTELATMGSTTASALADLTQAEVQILDGATVTTDELNILDGVTATKDEINILDGVTATKDEINILDGLTATTAELNKLDGVTATTTELNKVDGLLATPTELNTLDGITSNTSELNKLDGVTASTTELNIVAGKSFKTSSGTLDTTSDTEIPSSKVIAAHVASSQTAIGGFTTIADEESFPNTQPATGVIVSINNAANLSINSSGVSTSGKRLDNTTVTINGFPPSLHGEDLAAGVGLIVVSASTANTYNYHKILSSETDVKQLSDDINSFNSRYRISPSTPSSDNDDGDLWFNSTSKKMMVYNGDTSSFDAVASVGNFYINTLSGAGGSNGNSSGNFDGAAKQFTLSNAGTSAQQHIVSVNGVIQKPNSGTSFPSEGFAISGNDILFSEAPPSGSLAFIITCGSSVSIGTPSVNSVNATHIIDGSITNAEISSSAAIALSKLDTTGTASNSNYLRGDGAWTAISTVPDEVNITANNTTDESVYPTFVDGATGAQGLETDADLVYNPNTGYLTATGFNGNGSQLFNLNYAAASNTGLVGTANMGSGTASSSTFLRGDRTWQAISAAPEVELTADGAIGNNVACNIKSNGKVEAITEVAAGSNYIAAATGSGASYTNITYDREHNFVVAWFRQSNDLKCVVGTPSGEGSTSTITWGSVQTVHDSDSDYLYITAEYIHFNDTNKHVLSYFDGSSRPFNLRAIVVDVASNGTVSTGGPQTIQQSGNAAGNLTAERGEICNGHETSYPYLLFYIKSSTDQLQWRDGTVDTANNTTTASGGGNCLGPGSSRFRDDGMYCFSYKNNTRNTIVARDNGSPTWYYNTRISGSWKTSATFGTSISRLFMFHDTTSDKMFAFYRENGGDLKWKSGTPDTASTGGGITSWSSDTTIRTAVSGWIGQHPIVTWDTKNSKYWLMLSEDSPAQKTFLWGFTISSAGAITWDSEMKEIQAGQRTAQHVFYETSLGNVIATSAGETWTSYSASSTMDSSNFLGWSAAAASDGATAKVKVVGNTVTGLSGLTPGKKYYVQRDGSVGLTPVAGLSVEAGLALTSTSLLLK